MTKQQFIDEYYIEIHKKYYSYYDIVEKGFAYQDASCYTLIEVTNEYNKFLKNKKEWLKNYKW